MQGVVAKVEWENLGGHENTGIFSTGTDKAIVRLSEAMFLNEYSKGLTPSMALKFLIDG